jgi:hypothetical protein
MEKETDPQKCRLEAGEALLGHRRQAVGASVCGAVGNGLGGRLALNFGFVKRDESATKIEFRVLYAPASKVGDGRLGASAAAGNVDLRHTCCHEFVYEEFPIHAANHAT